MATAEEVGPSRTGGTDHECSCIHVSIGLHTVVPFKRLLLPSPLCSCTGARDLDSSKLSKSHALNIGEVEVTEFVSSTDQYYVAVSLLYYGFVQIEVSFYSKYSVRCCFVKVSIFISHSC